MMYILYIKKYICNRILRIFLSYFHATYVFRCYIGCSALGFCHSTHVACCTTKKTGFRMLCERGTYIFSTIPPTAPSVRLQCPSIKRHNCRTTRARLRLRLRSLCLHQMRTNINFYSRFHCAHVYFACLRVNVFVGNTTIIYMYNNIYTQHTLVYAMRSITTNGIYFWFYVTASTASAAAAHRHAFARTHHACDIRVNT